MDSNLIDEFTPLIKKVTNSPDNACYTAAQFLIANALSDCTFMDSMGPVTPNISVISIQPSSSFKTPQRDMIAEIYEKTFKNMGVHFKSKYTTEGLMNGLNKHRQKYEKEGSSVPTYKCMILRDEVSNLAKEAHGGRSANVWEFNSELLDGYISPYDTVRGNDQTFPRVLFNMWFWGTPVFYELISDDFWNQGFAYRNLFLEPMKNHVEFSLDINLRGQVIQTISDALIPLMNITKAVATKEWEKSYLEYVTPMFERQNKEVDILTTADQLPIEIRAEKKYPELVIKLSMIHCISRGGYEGNTMTMDLIDLDNAIKDLEKYQLGFIKAYETYLIKKNPSMKTMKITVQRKIIMDYLSYSSSPQDRYVVHVSYEKDEHGNEIEVYTAKSDPRGEYIKKSTLYSPLGRIMKKDLDFILATMADAEDIELLEDVENEITKRKLNLICLKIRL
jgi:hypothetical protein